MQKHYIHNLQEYEFSKEVNIIADEKKLFKKGKNIYYIVQVVVLKYITSEKKSLIFKLVLLFQQKFIYKNSICIKFHLFSFVNRRMYY